MEQSDAFISYRRKDVDFVKQLVDALRSTGRELWVDWDDIPPGVEGFADEIQRGIEGADSFIAILSPAYLESEYCLMELREALRLKKRVVPVVYQKFDPTPAPDGIGHINWVYFTPHAGQQNSFEQSLPRVIQALEADYEHAREHTRLLRRALDWDKRKREKSYLLRGAEIDQAEGWQVKATGKNPPVTELQLEYVLNSRKEQRDQQRRFTLSIGVLLVLAVIAAVYAVVQAGIARTNAAISHSNALASAALQPGNEDLAVALALEATRSEHAPDSVYKTLADVSYASGGIRYLVKSDADILPYYYPAISPDGQFAVIKNQLYDLKSGQIVRTFEKVPEYVLAGLFMPDGKSVILAGDDSGYSDLAANPDPVYLGMYDVETGRLIQKFDTGIGVSEIQVNEDATILIGYQPDWKIIWWDVHTGEKLRELENGYDPITISPDLKWMARVKNNQVVALNHGPEKRARVQMTGLPPELKIINLQTGEEKTIVGPDSYEFKVIRFSPDSRELAVFMSNRTTGSSDLSTIAIETGETIFHFNNPPSALSSIRYSSDGTKIVTATTSQASIIWDSQTGGRIKELSVNPSPLLFASFVHDDEWVATMDEGGTLIVWDTMPGNFEKRLPFDEVVRTISADGKYLISETHAYMGEQSYSIWKTENFSQVSKVPMPSGSSTTSYYLMDGLEKGIFSYTVETFSEAGNVTALSLHVASLTEGEIINTWTPDPAYSIQGTQFGGAGDVLYIYYLDENQTSHLAVWDIYTDAITDDQIEVPNDFLLTSFDPTGSRLFFASAVAKAEGQSTVILQMIDTTTRKTLFTMETEYTGVDKFLFNSDGTKFLVVTGDPLNVKRSRVGIHDSQTGKRLVGYTLNVGADASFQISPDGQTVSSSIPNAGGGGGGCGLPSGICFLRNTATSGSSTLWNSVSGDMLWQFPDAAYDSFFSPDGHRLYIQTWNDLVVWRLDSQQELISWACINRYVAKFTPQQRERFGIENETGICTTLEE